MRLGRTILGQGACVARRCSPTELYVRTSQNSPSTHSGAKAVPLAAAVSGWGGQTPSALPTCARGRCAFCA
jgi:hypothetical protein